MLGMHGSYRLGKSGLIMENLYYYPLTDNEIIADK